MAVPTILQHPKANLKAFDDNIIFNARYPILSLQVICADEFFIEQKPGMLAGLLHQSGFLEIFYCAGMERGGKPLAHAFLCQTSKGGVLAPKFI